MSPQRTLINFWLLIFELSAIQIRQRKLLTPLIIRHILIKTDNWWLGMGCVCEKGDGEALEKKARLKGEWLERIIFSLFSIQFNWTHGRIIIIHFSTMMRKVFGGWENNCSMFIICETAVGCASVFIQTFMIFTGFLWYKYNKDRESGVRSREL